MMCPDCRVAAPGGTACPRCGNPVPERESFGGQGGYYLQVLLGVAAVILAAFVIGALTGPGIKVTLRRMYFSGWLWLYIALFATPVLVGLYYWHMLHDEEVTVTDDYIARRSHWGDETLAWTQVVAFRCIPILFRQTRLRHMAWLSRFVAQERLVWRLPPQAYELEGPPDENGLPSIMRLEPGTIDEMPWLLELIQERIGPPSDEH